MNISCPAIADLGNGSVVCVHSMLVAQHAVLIPLNVLNIVLNSSTIAAVALSRKLHTIPSVLIVSLAVSDVVEGVMSLCTDILFFALGVQCSRNCENDFVEGDDGGLKIFRYLLASSFSCNYFSLLIIAVQQWLFISQPFLYDRLVTAEVTAGVIAVCFVLSFLINLDVVLARSSVKSHNEVYDRRVFIAPAMHTATSIIMFAIYLHITVIAFRQVRSLSRQISDIPGPSSLAEAAKSYKIKSNWKSLKMFFTSFGVFFVCLSPLVYYRAFHGHSQESLDEWRIVFILETLPAVHYVANFFVLVTQHRDLNSVFKVYMRKAVCHKK